MPATARGSVHPSRCMFASPRNARDMRRPAPAPGTGPAARNGDGPPEAEGQEAEVGASEFGLAENGRDAEAAHASVVARVEALRKV